MSRHFQMRSISSGSSNNTWCSLEAYTVEVSELIVIVEQHRKNGGIFFFNKDSNSEGEQEGELFFKLYLISVFYSAFNVIVKEKKITDEIWKAI